MDRGSIESIDSIRVPTLPRTLVRLREMLTSDKYGLSEVAALIANDPPLAARTLRIANSAQYGLRTRTLSVRTAATVLGMRTLSTLVMQAGVISVFEHLDDTRGFDVESFWRHAILTGHISSVLATRFRRHESDLAPEEYYTCGLLHDIGQLVMLDNFGIDYLATILISRTVEEQLQNERERFGGSTHCDVGALSASTWGLPVPIADMIKFHHNQSKHHKAKDVVQIIACADEIAEEIAAHERDDPMRIVRRLRTPLVGSGEVFLEGVVRNGVECWRSIEL